MKKVMLSDSRVSNAELIREYEFFTYSREEMETVLNYDVISGKWKFWSNYTTHITKLLKLNGVEVTIESVGESGNITSMSAILDAKQVRLVNKVVLSEEKRAELSERAKSLHKR